MNLCQKVECPYGGWSQDKVVLEDYIICGDLVRYLVDKSASNVKERLDALEGDLDQWRDAQVRASFAGEILDRWLDDEDESSKARSWRRELAATDEDAEKAVSGVMSILNIEDEDEVYEMLYGTYTQRSHLAKSPLYSSGLSTGEYASWRRTPGGDSRTTARLVRPHEPAASGVHALQRGAGTGVTPGSLPQAQVKYPRSGFLPGPFFTQTTHRACSSKGGHQWRTSSTTTPMGTGSDHTPVVGAGR